MALYTYVDESGDPVGPPLIHENVYHMFSSMNEDGSMVYQDITPELLATRNLAEIKNSVAPFPEEWEDLQPGDIVKNSAGEIEQLWIRTELSNAEKYRRWIHGYRLRRFMMSDWTQLADADLTPEEKTAWTAYRQQLRDMTDTIDLSLVKSHLSITWPVPPWDPEQKWSPVTNP
jgi:hypothetical protein